MSRARLEVLLFTALALAATACTLVGRSPAGETRSTLKVVTTVSPITNIVENVAGADAEIVGIVPEGVNSHTFEPAPSDVRLLAEADLAIANGLGLEEAIIELAASNLPKSSSLIELGPRTIDPDDWIFDFSFPRRQGHPNPHLWTNPRLGARFSEIVADELSKASRSHADTFRQNQKKFARAVSTLDKALVEATASVPPERRRLLTYHDSFPYFAKEYGWEVVGAIQPSDFSEPTAREVADLIEQVKVEKVPAIFGSEVFPSPVLEQIADATGAKYVSALRDDDLPGEEGDPGHTYLGLLQFDFITIVEALGGDATALYRLEISNVAGGSAKYRG